MEISQDVVRPLGMSEDRNLSDRVEEWIAVTENVSEAHFRSIQRR